MHDTCHMPDSDPINEVPVDKLRDPEAQLGGADNVQKTTYVVGEGTSPDRRKSDRTSARAKNGGGAHTIVWVVVVLVILGALVLALGLGR